MTIDLINGVRDALHEMSAKRNDFLFAGLIEREEAPYSFDVVVGADWIDNKRSFIEAFYPLLQARFGPTELQKFGGIIILNPKGEFLQEYSQIIGPASKDQTISNVRIGETNVRWGHIFATQHLLKQAA